MVLYDDRLRSRTGSRRCNQSRMSVPMTRTGTASSQTYQLTQSAASCMMESSSLCTDGKSKHHTVDRVPEGSCRRPKNRQEMCRDRSLQRRGAWLHDAVGNFCRRKKLTRRDAVPTAVGMLRVLFQQPDQLRQPRKQGDAETNRECDDRRDQVFVEPRVCGEDHGGDGRRHRGNQDDDRPLHPREL